MKTKFEHCLDYLEKNASEITRAGGLGRFKQLLGGSRARALEERAQGIHGASMRAWRAATNAVGDVHAANATGRMNANVGASARAAREAEQEKLTVRATRGLTAGGLGAAAIGAATHFQDPEPPEGAPPEKKSPLWEGAKTIGTSLAGFGLGQLAGAGIGALAERGAKARGVDPAAIAQTAAPLIGGAAVILYPMWRAREQKELTNAVEGARDQNERRLPG